MISTFIRDIKSEFGKRSLEETVEILKNRLPSEEDKYYELMFIANEHTEIKQEDFHGVSFYEQIQVRVNRVRKKLLDFIRNLKEEDFFGYSLEGDVIKYKDGRDNQTYEVIELFGQIWMAENLNFETKEGSWYYDDDPTYGIEHGCLYNWETANEVCWPGWRLPTIDDCRRFDQNLMKISTRTHDRYLFLKKLNLTLGGCRNYKTYEALNKRGCAS